MKEKTAGLQAYTDPVLMFNACLRAEYAYYRLVKATVAFQKVWYMHGAVYAVLLNVSCITITCSGGWYGWHDICCSNVWRAGLLEFFRGFADLLLMFKAAVVYVQLLCMWGNGIELGGKCVRRLRRVSLHCTFCAVRCACSLFLTHKYKDHIKQSDDDLKTVTLKTR